MGPAEATSPYLKAEVDCKILWCRESIEKFATPTNTVKQPTVAADLPCGSGLPIAIPKSPTTHSFDSIVADVFAELTDEEKAELTVDKMVPRSIDGKLLKSAANKLQRRLTDDEKRNLRASVKARRFQF
jgi:hypothetical protein